MIKRLTFAINETGWLIIDQGKTRLAAVVVSCSFLRNARLYVEIYAAYFKTPWLIPRTCKPNRNEFSAFGFWLIYESVWFSVRFG